MPELTRQYDEAFQQFDVLVMPTMPFVATTLTAADAPIEEYVHSALNMLANTAPFDLTGHPATRPRQSRPVWPTDCRSP